MKNNKIEKNKNNIENIKILATNISIILVIITLILFTKVPIYIKIELLFLISIPFTIIRMWYYKINGKEKESQKLLDKIEKFEPKGNYAGAFFTIVFMYMYVLLNLILILPVTLSHFIGIKYITVLFYLFFTLALLVLVYRTQIVYKLILDTKNKIFKIQDKNNTLDIVPYCRIIAYIIFSILYVINNINKFGIEIYHSDIVKIFKDIGLESVLTFIMIDTLIQIIIDKNNNRIK